MEKKDNATCSICGKPYHKCLSCKDSMNLKPWQIHCCSADCYKVFQVVRGFSTGVYDKDEAKEKFNNIDLSNLNTFRPHVKDIIKNILKEEKKVVESIVEIKSEAIESVDIIDKPISSRKRKFKVEVE